MYFCPMHSGVQQLHSGKCPKCNMIGAGRHSVRPALAHGEQPVAPRHHGRRHGRDHGSADDDDAVTAFKHCQTFGIVVEEFR